MSNQPKFNLNDKLVIRVLNTNFNITITRRFMYSDIDSGECEYYYNYKEENLNKYTWDRVPEISLLECIHEYEIHLRKNKN